MTNRKTEKPKNQKTKLWGQTTPFFRFSVFRFFGPRSGLTLIELMVSAVILSIGMVLVARGLMTASSALQTVDNRMEAFKFLDAKLTQLQQQAREEGGLAPARDTGTTQLNHRAAAWLVEIEPMDLEEALSRLPDGTDNPEGAGTIIGIPQEEAEGGPAITPPEVAIAQVRLSVSWQETRRNQEAVVVTYVGSKAPSATEQEE